MSVIKTQTTIEHGSSDTLWSTPTFNSHMRNDWLVVGAVGKTQPYFTVEHVPSRIALGLFGGKWAYYLGRTKQDTDNNLSRLIQRNPALYGIYGRL